jgi:penicillin-binding protein 2
MEPQQGTTLRTTLDIDLQQFMAKAFPPNMRGAVMAMDPQTGGVLGLYSSPSYDPNAFIGGADPQVLNALFKSEAHPLVDRAIQGRYPPASPWKLVMATIAMRRGMIDMHTHMPTPCTGGFQYYNRYFHCWKADGHGDVNLAEAIQQSCDVYFYQLGLKLGLGSMLQEGVQLGFDQRSGIDLPSEAWPTFPQSTQYYDRLYGRRQWTQGVVLNLAIGQGENAQTLSNMMHFYTMLANNAGAAPAPSLVVQTSGTDRSLGLQDSALAGLREALLNVVEHGTGAGARIAELKIAGKTGTAQNPHGPDHGWFIAFAPADSPRIVVGSIIEFAKHGTAVAPMVTSIIAHYLLGSSVDKASDYQLILPADSAPEPRPILPDTTVAPVTANAIPGAR